MSTRHPENANGGSAVSNGKGGWGEMALVFTLALLGVGLASLAAFLPWYESSAVESVIVEVRIPFFDAPDASLPDGADEPKKDAAPPFEDTP